MPGPHQCVELSEAYWAIANDPAKGPTSPEALAAQAAYHAASCPPDPKSGANGPPPPPPGN